MPGYAAPDTFARLPRLDQVQRAAGALLGVPFDSGVSYRPGARFGPAAVRAGSKLLRPYHPELDVYPWDVHQVADAGDVGLFGPERGHSSVGLTRRVLVPLAARSIRSR